MASRIICPICCRRWQSAKDINLSDKAKAHSGSIVYANDWHCVTDAIGGTNEWWDGWGRLGLVAQTDNNGSVGNRYAH